jgi:hypothetical protein
MAIVNEWQQVKSFPTPVPSDLLFYEIKDSNIPRNENWNYGDPHPNKTRYPDHELIFVTPVVKGSNPSAEQQWWYAAKRENQDDYNFSYTKADIGGTRFDAVARTYVTLRSAFTPDTPAMGATMPNDPESLFTGAYVLAEKRQTRIGEQELDSLYVAETHVYVKRATITNNGFNEALGVNLSRTTTLYYRGETVSGVAIETLVADDKNAYWGTQVNLKISRSGEQLSDNWFAVTEQQITLKRETSGALTDDWPIGQVKSKARENPTPQKFRASTNVVQTTTPIDLAAANVDNLPAPATPTGDEVEVQVTKINDYRYEKKITTETIDTDNPLTGTEWVAAFGGGILTTEETLASERTNAAGGFSIIRSKVTPIGQGKFIEEVGTMDSFPSLSGSKYDADLDINLPFTEQVVQAGTNSLGSDTEPIDEYRSKERTVDRSAVQAALAGIHLTLPSQENIQLPNVLKSVSVLASRSVGNGNSYGWGNSYSGSNTSSLAVSADLTYEIEEGYSGPVASEIHVFFLPLDGSSPGDILAAVNAEPWPMYRPISSRIVISGNGGQRSFSESVSDNSASASESSSVSAFTNVGVLPATLHGSMNIEVTYSDFTSPAGLLDATWAANVAANEARVQAVRNALETIPPTYAGEAVTPLQKQLLLTKLETIENTVTVTTDFDPTDAEVIVSPNTLEATSPSEIQYGRFVKSSSASIYGYGMVRVTAVVVDLSILAP